MLLNRALKGAELSETVAMFADQLVDGGVPVSRIIVGRDGGQIQLMGLPAPPPFPAR